MVRLVFRPYTQVDERFARQYRYEPPPGFPLASPSSGIVHHLSGPNRCAHTQTSLRKLKSVVHYKNSTCHFHYAHERFTHVLAHVLDSLVRVSRRVDLKPFRTDAADHACLTAQPSSEINAAQSLRARDTMQEYAASRKPQFTSDINQPEHSESSPNRMLADALVASAINARFRAPRRLR